MDVDIAILKPLYYVLPAGKIYYRDSNSSNGPVNGGRPDWADTEPNYEYKFINSNTRPPADVLLNRVFRITKDVALVLPPYLDTREFEGLPKNERELLFLGESHELYCIYFGDLISTLGETEFRVQI